MAENGGELEDVYASLLLTDTYLPGALVLAHSLRDAGTTKKLAILVTLDTVSENVVTQLRTVYDYIIPVDRIQNEHPANLDLMNRPDLHSAFTKINLWKQTQFRKIVYVDADIVAYRAPDELFNLEHAFSAAPDIGWPDLFNTGVMVLTPNMGDYYAMMAMAQRGISFDGADQGLINMFYKDNFNRLSFSYNVTPSAHYQYIPAYTHFQSSISMVHFIGANKPWIQGRDMTKGGSPFDQMVGRWWAVYDRHYRKEGKPGAPEIVQYFVKGEYQPTINYVVPVGEPASNGQSWDAQRHSPPSDSKPEAMNFPHTQYEMSSDPALFVPPDRYPSPPKNMGYEAPKEHFVDRPKPIFPWESHQPQPTRVFPHSEPTPSAPEKPTTPIETRDFAAPAGSKTPPAPTSRTALSAPSPTWSSFTLSNAWDTVPEINRYVETLQKHRRTRSRNQALAGGKTPPESPEFGWSRRGSKVTDFPGEDERPSLPVTPAPIRRPRRWGSNGSATSSGTSAQNEDDQLPAAEGVPAQSEWDPAAQLQKLAREQSEVLLQRLGDGTGQAERELPSRPLPFGSEDAVSPTYVAPQLPVVSPKPVKPHTAASPVNKILGAGTTATGPRGVTSGIPAPSYQGPGPAFEKGEDIPTHETPALPTEEERDVLET